MNIDDALNAAVEKLEAAEPAEAAPVEATAAAVAPEPEAAPKETAAEAERRAARDEKGRFAKPTEPRPVEPKAPEAKPEPVRPPDEAKPDPAVRESQLAGSEKAPVSWKPLAREKWAALPPEVREEWSRREKEMAGFVTRSGDHAKLAEQVRTTLSPYEPIARANGMDSMQFAGSVLQTAAVLQMGTPQQKAGVLAQLINAYGIDVDAVNAVMQGQAPQQVQPQQDVSSLVQQELDRRMRAATEQQAAQSWQEFQASAPEFLSDVQEDMKDILEMAARRGERNITYQQAYDRAVKLNEGVQQTLAQRKAAEAIRTPQPVTGQARAAASSVRSRPAAVPAAQPKGIDAAMRAAADKLGM